MRTLKLYDSWIRRKSLPSSSIRLLLPLYPCPVTGTKLFIFIDYKLSNIYIVTTFKTAIQIADSFVTPK